MLRLLVTLLVAGCLVLPAARTGQGPGAPTLIVRRGGTYTGTFRSPDAGSPCVRILTDEPVVLDGCTLEGPGTLIECLTPGAQLTVRRCVGRGLAPMQDQTARGPFLAAEEARSVRVEQCRLEHTTGIYIYKWSGDGSPGQTLKILGNVVRNIDGRYRDGGGTTASFVGLNRVHGVAGIEIAWNEVVNEPDRSMVEDNINLYNSSGTPAAPIRVHDNYVQGAYPYPATGEKFSGTGMTTDGDGSSALTTTAYVEAYSNQFVSICNSAMNIAAGHDVRFYNNRIVTSGLLPDGRKLRATYCGVSVFNHYEKPASVFFANRIDGNVIGYVRWGYQLPFPDRHDLSDGNCATCPDNQHLPNPITLDSEREEWQRWQRKMRSSKPGKRLVTGTFRAVQ
ncbi:hypothetical protein GCM10027048_21700 [Hymenobacter coalescens]